MWREPDVWRVKYDLQIIFIENDLQVIFHPATFPYIGAPCACDVKQPRTNQIKRSMMME
jgi:hypothetical protein